LQTNHCREDAFEWRPQQKKAKSLRQKQTVECHSKSGVRDEKDFGDGRLGSDHSSYTQHGGIKRGRSAVGMGRRLAWWGMGWHHGWGWGGAAFGAGLGLALTAPYYGYDYPYYGYGYDPYPYPPAYYGGYYRPYYAPRYYARRYYFYR